ncbi:MAG: hypothetical protein JXA68_05810 [Ignavibacteriales bacterium]|nr:hypothetical protein [Ignavibacteriales bacterium]
MSRYYLKETYIEGFRGINNENNPLILQFNHNGVTSFFAENGQGKSSIYEALYYSINNKFPKIDKLHRELQDYSTIRNLFHSGNGQIKLIFCDDLSNDINIDFTIDSSGNCNITSPNVPNPKDFIKELRDEHNFLDYATFTNIITQSPEDAGETFSALIGYSKFSELKDKLDKLSRTQNINTDFDKKNKENKISFKKDDIYNRQVEILNKLNAWNIRYKLFNLFIIEKRLLKELKSLFPFIVEPNIYKIDYDTLLVKLLGNKYDENINKQAKLIELINQYTNWIKQLKSIKRTTFNKFNSSLKKAYRNLDNIKDIYLGSLYEKALDTYNNFVEIDKNTCILCNTKDLGNSKQSFYEIINTKITKYRKFKVEVVGILTGLENIVLNNYLIDIENDLLKENKIRDIELIFKNLKFSTDEIISEDFFIKNDLNKIVKKYVLLLSERLHTLQTEYKNISLKVPKNITELNEKINLFKVLKDDLINIATDKKEINETKEELFNIEKWVNYITIVKDNFDLAYNNLMEQISIDINKDAQAFFCEIMGNNEIIPFLEKKDTGQKINLILKKFYSASNKKAANLLSESYRNALCLSIYFATAIRNISTSKFIVLDDITSSFDSGHQIKLIDVLENHIGKAKRNKGKQVILFTHDGELKKVLSSKNIGKNNWQHHKIYRTLCGSFTSLKEINSDHLKNELISKLNNGDTEIRSLLREYFEETIFEIIEALNLPIPFRDLYDLSNTKLENLLNSIERHLTVEKNYSPKKVILPIPSSTYFRNIQGIANKVSHFASNSKISYTPHFLLQCVNDIEDYKRKYQYFCNCHLNQGWVYYYSIFRKKGKNECKC